MCRGLISSSCPTVPMMTVSVVMVMATTMVATVTSLSTTLTMHLSGRMILQVVVEVAVVWIDKRQHQDKHKLLGYFKHQGLG